MIEWFATGEWAMSILDLSRGARRGALLARVLGNGPDRRAVAPSFPPSPVPPRLEIAFVPAPAAEAEPSSESRLYLEGRRQIKRRAWGYAQRALEEAARGEPDGPAALDLRSVRTIRRSLRRLSRWPSDAETRLELGRAYFDLDLGDEAQAEFAAVQRLAPHRYEGFVLAALEYVYRCEYGLAASAWARARGLNSDLPELQEILGSLPV